MLVNFREFVLGSTFLIVLATACASVFWFILHSREMQSTLQEVRFASLQGSEAPEFSLKTIDGKTLVSRPRSNPLVLEIYASWCGICASEIPTLNGLARQRRDVEVAAVTGDRRSSDQSPETLKSVERYRATNHVAFELAFDPTMSVANQYRIVGFPSIFVIDRRGLLVFNRAGAVDRHALDSAIALALR